MQLISWIVASFICSLWWSLCWTIVSSLCYSNLTRAWSMSGCRCTENAKANRDVETQRRIECLNQSVTSHHVFVFRGSRLFKSSSRDTESGAARNNVPLKHEVLPAALYYDITSLLPSRWNLNRYFEEQKKNTRLCKAGLLRSASIKENYLRL